MNQHEYMEAVYGAEIDVHSKAILIYYAHRKNFKNGGKVWPSAETISKESGVALRTVERRIPQLRDAGWLVDTGERKPNGKGRPSVVYDLAIGSTFPATRTAKSDTFTATETGKVGDFPARETDLSRQNGGTFPPETQTFTAPLAVEQERELDMELETEQETTVVADAPTVSTPNLEVKARVEEEEQQPLLNLETTGGLDDPTLTFGTTRERQKQKELADSIAGEW